MLSRQLEVSLRLAVTTARQKHHEFLTVEHLLLSLLENDSAVNALRACGADVPLLRRELTEYIDTHTPVLPENREQTPQPTDSFDRILQRAIFHVQSGGNNRSVEGADVDTIRILALKSRETGADIHALGDAGLSGCSLPENIYQLSLSVKGRRLTWERMAGNNR